MPTYRAETRYRSGRIYRWGTRSDTGSGADAQSLSVVLTSTDTGSGAEGTPSSISVTLEGGGPVLEWVTGITDSHSLGVSSTDTGSGTSTQISGIAASSADTGSGADAHGVSLSQTESGDFVDTLLSIAMAATQADTGTGSDASAPGIDLSSSDVAVVSMGGMPYRSNEDYRTYGNYRQLGEQTSVDIGVEELITALEALGDRVFSDEETAAIMELTNGPIGTVAGPLSLRVDMRYRTNRAGRFPGRMRSRR